MFDLVNFFLVFELLIWDSFDVLKLSNVRFKLNYIICSECVVEFIGDM